MTRKILLARPSLPAPVAWLDAQVAASLFQDAALTIPAVDGGLVGGMTARSSILTVTQATTSKKPVYAATAFNGRPCVQFDGVDDYLRGNFAASLATLGQPVTLALVGQMGSVTGANKILVAGAASTAPTFRSSPGPPAAWQITVGSSASADAPNTAAHVHVWVIAGGIVTYFRDGMAIAVTGTISATAVYSGLTLASQGGGSGATFGPLTFAELQLFNNALTPGQIQGLTTGLKLKWGIP